MNSPTVFISAATEDLKEWRETLHKAFTNAQFNVLTQNHSLGVADAGLRSFLTDSIGKSDFVVHLAGMAYGSHADKPFSEAPGFQCSWTQFEYYYAHQRGKKVIAFVCAPSLSREGFRENGSDAADIACKQALQQQHRARIASGSFAGTPLEEKPLTLNQKVDSVPELITNVAAAVRKIAGDAGDAGDFPIGLVTKLLAILEETLGGLKTGNDAPPFDLNAYAEALQRHCLRIPLTDDFGSGGMDRLTLREIFVPPSVRLFPLRDPREIELPDDTRQAALRGETEHLPPGQREKAELYGRLHREQTPQPALGVILTGGSKGNIILGDAGLGKTSLVRHLALAWAERWLANPVEDAANPIPLYIELKSYAAAAGSQLAVSIRDYLQHSQHSICHLPKHECNTRLADGRAFLILDALDEVTITDIQESIARQAHEILRTGARIVVTSRANGFIREHWPGDGVWLCWHLQEFEKEERELFIKNAAPLLWSSESDRRQRLADLDRRLRSYPAIERLARNPLLLTLIVLMHRSNRLGESRVAIYGEAGRWLLDRWEEIHRIGHSPNIPAALKRRIVRRLARRIHERDPSALPGENIFPLSVLQDVIREIVDPKNNNPMDAERYAAHLPQLLRERHSLLCWVGGEQYAFVHRSFLEFFAAEAWKEEGDLAGLAPAAFRASLLEKNDLDRPPHWQDERYGNVLPLYFGLLGEDRATERLPLLLELGAAEHSDDATLFAASCFSEVQDRSLHPDFAKILKERLITLAESEWIQEGGMHDQNEAATECRCRAVQHIAKLYGDSHYGELWLWQELANHRRHWRIREEIIRQLAHLLGRHAGLQATLSDISKKQDEHVSLRVQAVRTLAQVWNREEWLRDLLVTLSRAEDEAPYMRRQVVEILGAVWPKADWLREFLVSLTRPEEKDGSVRRQAIRTLQAMLPKTDWLSDLIVTLTRADEKQLCTQAIR